MKSTHGKNIQLLGTTTLGPKGQVVIPAEAREKMGIKPGDKLVALYVNEKNAIGFVSTNQLQDLIDKMGDHVESLRKIIKK